MKQSLMRLLDLQEVDGVIDELEASKSQYPIEIDLLNQEIEAAARSLTKLEEEIDELEKKRRHFEGELELANAELLKHQRELDQIRTNKEYDALRIEIEECKRRANESENEILQAMTALEETTKRMQEDKKAFAQMEKEKKSRIAELSEKLASLEHRMSVQQQQRADIAKDIKKGPLKAYERIRKAGKAGVATVARGSCGGCYKRLPPQKIIEIRKSAGLIACENCGRILVWDSGGD